MARRRRAHRRKLRRLQQQAHELSQEIDDTGAPVARGDDTGLGPNVG